MPLVPKPLVWQFSRRYVAGTGLQDAFATVRELNAAGCSATVDVLGEDSTGEEQVRAAESLYLEAIKTIQAESLDCSVSIKLSDMGLRYDVDRCREAMLRLVTEAFDRDCFVRIDMEDSSVTDLTLDVYRELRADFDNVGIVLQACLRRSQSDIAVLIEEGIANVRLCKGIYIEPPDIAYTEFETIQRSFDRLLGQLFVGEASHVAIATHDPVLVESARSMIAEKNIERDHFEFQMLLGVAEPMRRELVAAGFPLRVYVPFGERWYAYSMRRLRENPNIAGHIVGNLLRRR